MHFRTEQQALPSPIPDTFELSETIQNLVDSVRNDFDPRLVAQIARKAINVADMAAWRIREQSRRIAELERDVVTDPLTGVLNRRGFEAELVRALADGRRYGEHGALIYLDLDGFKEINDEMGHSAGDAVLRKFANILSSNVRDTDRVGRLGGDEFAILMSRTTVENATARSDKIEWLIETSAIDWQGQTINIKASLGIDYFGADDGSSDVICRADENMYRKKLASRHVHSAKDDDSLPGNGLVDAVIPITPVTADPF